MDFWMQIPAIGSIFNAGAVVVGGCIGIFAGRFIPDRLQRIVFQCFGLFSLYLGFDMAGKGDSTALVLFGLVLGAIWGELWDLDAKLNSLGEYLKARINTGSSTFTEGFVTTTLFYCVGSMSILGALQEGLQGDPSLLFTKGMMDGTLTILFAASLGVGTLFSALPLLIYEGGITLAAGWFGTFLTPAMIDNMSGVGGLMIVGLGLNLLQVAQIKVSNFLPGLLVVVLLTRLFQ